MATKIIKALLVEPGKHPKTTYIPSSTAVFNSIINIGTTVDSCAAKLRIGDNVLAIYNEDGALHDLPGNRKIGDHVITGVFLLVAVDSYGYICSMSNDILHKYKSMFWQPEKLSDSEVYQSHFNHFYRSIDELEFS